MMNLNSKLARKRQELEENGEKGFTLIELLVVVLIIGILTAIAVPIFIGQQDQAKDAAAKSDLGIAKVAMISHATANSGVYLGVSNAAATELALKDYGYVKSANVTSPVAVISSAAGAFCLQATSGSTKVFSIKDTGGVVQAPC